MGIQLHLASRMTKLIVCIMVLYLCTSDTHGGVKRSLGQDERSLGQDVMDKCLMVPSDGGNMPTREEFWKCVDEARAKERTGVVRRSLSGSLAVMVVQRCSHLYAREEYGKCINEVRARLRKKEMCRECNECIEKDGKGISEGAYSCLECWDE